ncbi:fumarylacetoacetase [Achromobacter aloeverae]
MTAPCPPIDATHDPDLRSWVDSANAPGCDFPIQNLPFTRFSPDGEAAPRIGVGIGDAVLDVAAVAHLFEGPARDAASACGAPWLNALMAVDPAAQQALRAQLSALLDARQARHRAAVAAALHPLARARLHAPARIGGYTDFFASIHHATNAGSLFRPDAPLLPNYKYVPVAYNGRANSVGVHAEVTRPCGQVRPQPQAGEAPVYAPSDRLDYEVELGAYIGRASSAGQPVPVGDAWNHIFGFSLLNDWSARDIQAWEYQPLGPFLGKSFATGVSPWIVTAQALAPFRTGAAARPAGDPAPLPHLHDPRDQQSGGIDITLEAHLRSARMIAEGLPALRLSQANTRTLYWTVAQMVAHHTSNGSWLDTGDLLGSGTVSGPEAGSWGSLLELTRGGAQPLALPNGETRRFLADGDEITLTGHCSAPGRARIGFGECRARVRGAGDMTRN